MSKTHNIQPDAMLTIVRKFQPLYDQMNQENQKVIYEAFEDFFESTLEKSFHYHAKNAVRIISGEL